MVVVVVEFGDWAGLLSLSACPSEESSSEVFRFLTDFDLDLLSFVFDFVCLVVCFWVGFLVFLTFDSSFSTVEPLKNVIKNRKYGR